MKSKISGVITTIVFSIFILTIVSSNLSWGKERWKGILESDAKGYYAYLPAVFIYNDLNFGFFDKIEKEKYFDKNLYYDYRSFSNNHYINKYYCGTALAEMPFFLVAHSLSAILHFEMDGYSKLYPIFINIAALFYLFLGLIFINKTLNIYAIKESQKILTILAAVFGTNLFYYTVGEPGMSHIFSFAFISIFFYFSKKYFSSPQPNHIFFMAITLGMIVLIRPVNGLIILSWPFAAGSFYSLKSGIQTAFKNYKVTLLSLFGFFIIIFIQLIIYKISTGQFLVYAYGEEQFHFLSPHIADILFSYKKGLFLYTPIYLISLVGLYFLLKENKFEFYSILSFFILLTYVFSSWWMWYYGGSFSSRVYVEYIPLFMILLALAINRIKVKPIKLVYSSLIIVLIILCQIQTYQYRYYQIHWANMTKEKYWDVFLRIDQIK